MHTSNHYLKQQIHKELKTFLNYNNLNSYANCNTTLPTYFTSSHLHNNVKHTTTVQGIDINIRRIESGMTLRQNVYVLIYHMY